MKLIDWYIKRYWGRDYIRRTEIAEALVIAKENEAERLRPIFEEEKQFALEIQEQELRMEMAEIQAECSRLKSTIADLRELRKAVERESIVNKKNSRKNLLVSSEIKNIVTKLLNNVGEVQGMFDVVTRTAQKHVTFLDEIPSITEQIGD
jgi:hypothetical protein